jgi:hypothetical protein
MKNVLALAVFLVSVMLNAQVYTNSTNNVYDASIMAKESVTIIDSVLKNYNSLKLIKERLAFCDTLFYFSDKAIDDHIIESLKYSGKVIRIERNWFDSINMSFINLRRLISCTEVSFSFFAFMPDTKLHCVPDPCEKAM